MTLQLPPALAAAAGGENAPLDLDSGGAQAAAGGGGSLVRTIVGLAIVLAVIYGLHWVLKQVKASREGRAAGGGLVPVATLPLGSNRSLHVVRAGREVLVLGAAEHGVTPLRVYSETEARTAGLLDGDDELIEGTAVEVAAPPGTLPAPRRALDAVRAWTVRG
jgi:flagellar protein FliO/FliZ